MIKKLFILVLLLIAGFLIAASLQPAEFRTERSLVIAAPPAVVFDQINDFHKWDKWSPWAKMDPKANNTFGGPDTGVGSTFAWDGNSEVGAGKMTVTDYKPGELLRLHMEFIKPFTGSSTAEFTFKPEGQGTKATWAMYGPNNFIGKMMSLVFNCDKMVGGKFEEGLAAIKTLAEAKK